MTVKQIIKQSYFSQDKYKFYFFARLIDHRILFPRSNFFIPSLFLLLFVVCHMGIYINVHLGTYTWCNMRLCSCNIAPLWKTCSSWNGLTLYTIKLVFRWSVPITKTWSTPISTILSIRVQKKELREHRFLFPLGEDLSSILVIMGAIVFTKYSLYIR